MQSDSVGRRRTARGTRLSIVWTFFAFTLAIASGATTLLPIADSELRDRSVVIVEGWVEKIEPFESSRGLPETQTTIRPVAVFKGELSGPLVVRDRGGALPDGRWLKIWGRPDYVVGRRVLVFAIPHPDGEFQTAEFTLGKFEVWKDEAGRRFLARDLVTRSRNGVHYVGKSLEPAEDTLRDYVSFVHDLRFPSRAIPPAAAPRATGSLVPESLSAPGVRPLWADWDTNERFRWSNGATASWILSSVGNLSAGGGHDAARSAIASWTGHPTSTINYSDGGVGSSGTNFIDLASTSVCGTSGAFCGSGVLGCAGPTGVSGTHTWRGETYGTITRAHVEIRQSTGSNCISSGTFAAAVTHELGHTLGFAHADQGASPHDVCRGDESSAQMRSIVQSRGSSLGTDDSDAARWVYGDGGNSCTAAPTETPSPTRTPTTVPPTATRTPTPTRTATPPGPTATRTPTSQFPTATRTPASPGPTPTPTFAAPQPTSPPGPIGTPTPSWTPSRTPTATRTPTPPPPTGNLRANFSWSPPSPRPGEVVQFLDLSSGAAARWTWRFGSGNLEEGTSSLRNPTWVFPRESTYTVTLTVEDSAGARSTRRRKVSVSAASPFSAPSAVEVRTIPVAGHVVGTDGRTFVTDVQIENSSDAPAAAELTFQPAGGSAPPAAVPIRLGPRETRHVGDAVLALFGISDALGALRLEWREGPSDALRMTSRTYTRSADGTLGLSAGGTKRPEDGWTPRFVTGLARNDLLRSNVGAVNDSAEFQSFQIILRERSGAILGSSSVIGLAPGRQTQLAVAELFPIAWGKGMTAEIRPVGGSSAPFAYAATVDNLSGDSTFYSAGRPAPSLHLPGVARVTGYGGAVFTSDLSIANAGDAPTEVEVRFLERDRDNSRSPAVRLYLAPRETFQVDDALAELFGVSETFGALAIQSANGKLAVSERISTPSPDGLGTLGQQVDAVPDHGFFSRGSLLGLRFDAQFRSNVGVFNPEPFEASVELVLRRTNGEVLGVAGVTVPPLGYVQRSLRALFPGSDLPDGETMTLSIDSGGVDVFAFAAVIDNVSQDPTFSPGLR